MDILFHMKDFPHSQTRNSYEQVRQSTYGITRMKQYITIVNCHKLWLSACQSCESYLSQLGCLLIMSLWGGIHPPPLIARFMCQHGAHLGSIGPRWASCWPNEPCYLSRYPDVTSVIITKCDQCYHCENQSIFVLTNSGHSKLMFVDWSKILKWNHSSHLIVWISRIAKKSAFTSSTNINCIDY